jgi:hypothetical protein
LDNRDQLFLSLKAEIDRQAMETAFAYEGDQLMQCAVLTAHALPWMQALAASLESREAALHWLAEQMGAAGHPVTFGKPRLVVSN